MRFRLKRFQRYGEEHGERALSHANRSTQFAKFVHRRPRCHAPPLS
jgi:hypothetical protein